jgi:hypothetical protein
MGIVSKAYMIILLLVRFLDLRCRGAPSPPLPTPKSCPQRECSGSTLGSALPKRSLLEAISRSALSVDECSYGRHPPAYKPMRCGT